MFQDQIGQLSQVKRGVFEKIQAEGVAISPTVAGALRNFDTFIDTTYLWMLQLTEFARQGGTGDVEEAIATAEAAGEITTLPGE